MPLSQNSLARLAGVHPDLVAVIKKAAENSAISFQVTEGVRTIERQRQMVAKGASQTMNSRHIPAADGYGHAVDLVVIENGKQTWDFEKYRKLAVIVKAAASQLNIPIVWGGDWNTLKDGPHFELDRKRYPGTAGAPAPKPATPAAPVASVPPADRKVLRQGDDGEDVSVVQGVLIARGFHLDRIDGQFGPGTATAIRAFQTSRNLTPDGVVGPATRKALGLL